MNIEQLEAELDNLAKNIDNHDVVVIALDHEQRSLFVSAHDEMDLIRISKFAWIKLALVYGGDDTGKLVQEMLDAVEVLIMAAKARSVQPDSSQ